MGFYAMILLIGGIVITGGLSVMVISTWFDEENSGEIMKLVLVTIALMILLWLSTQFVIPYLVLVLEQFT